MGPPYACPRCGKSFKQCKDFKDHLGRKRLCPPTIADIALESVKQDMFENHSYAKTKDMKTMQTFNFYNCTVHMNNGEVTTIKPIGYPNTDHVTHEIMTQVMKDFPAMMSVLVKEVYFNPDVKENHCIRRHDGDSDEECSFRVMDAIRRQSDRKRILDWRRYTYENLVCELMNQIIDITDLYAERVCVDEDLIREYDKVVKMANSFLMGRHQPTVDRISEYIRDMLNKPDVRAILEKPLETVVHPSAGSGNRTRTP